MDTSLLILVAEDEFLIGESIQVSLEDAGFGVLRAASGEEALAALDAEEPKCRALVTDVRVGPGPSGWELARHAREEDPCFPVIYVSGDSAHEHAVHGVPQSVMIQKPFVAAQIVTALATLLNDLAPARPAE